MWPSVFLAGWHKLTDLLNSGRLKLPLVLRSKTTGHAEIPMVLPCLLLRHRGRKVRTLYLLMDPVRMSQGAKLAMYRVSSTASPTAMSGQTIAAIDLSADTLINRLHILIYYV